MGLMRFKSTIYISGREVRNIRFVNDIDLIAVINVDLQKLAT